MRIIENTNHRYQTIQERRYEKKNTTPNALPASHSYF